MSLSIEHVQKVANLARLKLSDQELQAVGDQLGRILDYVATLEEVDTSQIEPMVHAIELSNVLRDDVVRSSLPRAAGLSNAPRTDGKHFLVPQVLDADG